MWILQLRIARKLRRPHCYTVSGISREKLESRDICLPFLTQEVKWKNTFMKDIQIVRIAKNVRTHNVAAKRQNFSKAAGARNGIQVSPVIYWTA